MKLRSHLVLLVLGSVLPVLLFAGVLVALLAGEQRAAVELGLRGTTRALSAAVDERVASVIASLGILAASEDLDPRHLDDVHRRASRAVKSQEGWRAISLARATGEHLLTTERPLGVPLAGLSQEPYFARAIETRMPAISGYRRSLTSGAAVVSVGVPVLRADEVAYVLTASLDVDALSQLLRSQGVQPEWTAAILDADAVLIGRSRAPEKFVGRPATPVLAERSRERAESVFEDVTQEGRPAYGSFRRSPLTGWTVVLGLPAESLRAPIERTLAFVLGGGAAFLLIGVAFAVVLGRRIARPIVALSGSAAALGQGKVQPSVDSSVAEVADVAHALQIAARERDRSEATLREANETFDALIQASPVAILALDPDGIVRVWNPAAEHIFATARDAVIGQRLASLEGQGPAALEELLLSTFDEEALHAAEWRGLQRQGDAVILQVSTAPLHTTDGARRYVMAILDDTTERTRALERLAEERHTVETLHHISAALASELDLQKLLQRLTDEATALTGAEIGAYFHTAKLEQGDSWTLYTLSGAPAEAFSSFGAPRSTAIFGPTFRGEGTIRLDDVSKDARYGKSAPHYGMPKGHPVVRSYLAVPVVSSTGDVVGGLFFGHSRPGVFSERHEHLMEAVAPQAAVAIDNASLYRQARDAVQLRDNFLSVASHELKTPLTPLLLQLGLLRERVRKGPGELSPEVLEKAVQRMLGQVNRLARLVDELLDVSRIAAGRMELHLEDGVDVVALLEEILSHFEAERARSGSTLTVQGPSAVVASWDRGRLEQIFTNLIANALKYGDGKPVDILVEDAEESVSIVVQDRGIGIPAEHHARVFERFERAVSSKNYGGLGLGLWIVRRIVDAMEGEISLDSAAQEGARFSVRLPKTLRAS